MAYVLSRHTAFRHVLAMTLEAGYVRSASVKGKARAFGDSSRSLSSQSLHPVSGQPGSTVVPTSRKSASSTHKASEGTMYGSERNDGIGDWCEEIATSSSPTISNQTPSLSYGPHGPLHWTSRPKIIDPFDTYKSLISLKPASMPASKLDQTLHTTYELLRSLEDRLSDPVQSDIQTRRAALKIYRMFFRLVERFQAEGRSAKVEYFLRSWVFHGAITLLYRYSRTEEQTKRLEEYIALQSQKSLQSSSEPLNRQPLAIHPLRFDSHTTPLEASMMIKRTLTTLVDAHALYGPRPIEPPPSEVSVSRASPSELPAILTISAVLQVMADFAKPMSREILGCLMKLQEAPLIPTGHRAAQKRAELGINHQDLGRDAVDTWSIRRDILDVSTSMSPTVEDQDVFAHNVMRTLEEADVLSLQYHAAEVEQKLEEMLRDWGGKRDILVQRANDRIRWIRESWKNMEIEPGAYPSRTIRAEDGADRRAVLLLLRNSLLPATLRRSSRPLTASASDPFDLLRLLVGLTTHPTQVEYHSDRILVRAIIRMRNAFFHDNKPFQILSLISFLSLPKDVRPSRIGPRSHIPAKMVIPAKLVVPRLPGVVYSSLITTAKNDDEFRDLLVHLACACPPATPAVLKNATRRLLRYQAQRTGARLTLSDHPLFHRMPQGAQERGLEKGHEGLLRWLFDQWNVVDIPTESTGMGRAGVSAQVDATLVRPLRAKRIRPFGNLPVEDRTPW